MGKLRKKYNWKGRQQNEPEQPVEKEKSEIVLELEGKTYLTLHTIIFSNL